MAGPVRQPPFDYPKEEKEMDHNCAYCAEGELVEAFGIKICELPE